MDRVLVATDGSAESQAALRYAFEQFSDAEVHVIHSPDTGIVTFGSETTATEEAERRAARILDDVARIAESHDREVETTLAFGNTIREIVRYVDEHDVDQVVLGTRGRSGTKRLLLGSVAEGVVRRSSCPVTVVR